MGMCIGIGSPFGNGNICFPMLHPGWVIPPKKLPGRNPAYVAQFLIETRRAEIAHWFMLGCLPIFFIWNPPWARWVMAVYALAANLPCICAQRYNRLVLNRIARARCRTLVRL